MVSFFGEVVFPSSRAFWADEEDAEESNISTDNFMIEWVQNEPESIENLLVVEGSDLQDFVKKCLCNNLKEVCKINCGISKNPTLIYEIFPELYMCFISTDLDVKLAGKFVNDMSHVLTKVKTSITIKSMHYSQYKCSNLPDDVSFLRCLATKSVQILPFHVPALEQPNIIHGFAAGVISYAEIMDRPAILYVLYKDGLSLDSKSALPVLELLSKLTNGKIENTISSAGKFYFNKGNLYMYFHVFFYFSE